MLGYPSGNGCGRPIDIGSAKAVAQSGPKSYRDCNREFSSSRPSLSTALAYPDVRAVAVALGESRYVQLSVIC